MTVHPTHTTRVPTGSRAFVEMMNAMTIQLPVGTVLNLMNKALAARELTPESLSDDDVPLVLHAMMEELIKFCRVRQVDELILDLASAGYPVRPLVRVVHR